MFVQGKCYKCGGFLAVNDADDASVCPFCSQPFIVQEAIRSFQETGPQPAAKPVREEPDSDFVTERSVLVRYNGYTQQDISIPEGITVIGEAAFQGMNNIETVRIPAGVELIGAAAFSGCRNLHTVTLPEGITTVDRDVFNGCTGLKSITFPDSIRHIEAGALAGCSGLESVSLPLKLEQLPWRIFEGCTALKIVRIPKNVKIIEDFAFADCTALEQVQFDCAKADKIPPAGVKRIGMNAFRNCTALQQIDLPESVEYIGNQAFRGCTGLTEVRIPAGVKAIYPLAFADCTELEQVTFAGKTELYRGSNPYKHGQDAATFFNCPKLLTVRFGQIQKHFWAFPAYMKSQEPSFIENGRCRYCGGEFKGLFEKVCSVCKTPKDY